MPNRLTALLLAVMSASAAALDVNHATRAELEAITGVGTALADRILKQRNSGPFKDWNDLIDRVKGLGPPSATRLSAAGLTVGGAPYAANAKP